MLLHDDGLGDLDDRERDDVYKRLELSLGRWPDNVLLTMILFKQGHSLLGVCRVMQAGIEYHRALVQEVYDPTILGSDIGAVIRMKRRWDGWSEAARDEWEGVDGG